MLDILEVPWSLKQGELMGSRMACSRWSRIHRNASVIVKQTRTLVKGNIPSTPGKLKNGEEQGVRKSLHPGFFSLKFVQGVNYLFVREYQITAEGFLSPQPCGQVASWLSLRNLLLLSKASYYLYLVPRQTRHLNFGECSHGRACCTTEAYMWNINLKEIYRITYSPYYKLGPHIKPMHAILPFCC